MSQLEIVGSDFDADLDRFSRIVFKIFDMPIVLISIVTDKQQWFKSCVGLPEDLYDARGTEREVAFCQYVVADKKPLVVEDALCDKRFIENRLVTAKNGIRFYAGVPLITKNKNILGTLCLIDGKKRSFTEENLDLLIEFAKLVINQIEMRSELNTISQVGIDIAQQNKTKK